MLFFSGKLSSMHFYGWKLGLKTGMYYLRTKPAAQAIQFTVDKTKVKAANPAGAKPTAEEVTTPAAAGDMASMEKNMAAMVCSIANKDDCLMCGS